MKAAAVVALMLALAYTSVRLAQTRMGLVHDRACFCDHCVKYNYIDNGNGIDYATEGK